MTNSIFWIVKRGLNKKLEDSFYVISECRPSAIASFLESQLHKPFSDYCEVYHGVLRLTHIGTMAWKKYKEKNYVAMKAIIEVQVR